MSSSSTSSEAAFWPSAGVAGHRQEKTADNGAIDGAWSARGRAMHEEGDDHTCNGVTVRCSNKIIFPPRTAGGLR
jgi:hypothetical protein